MSQLDDLAYHSKNPIADILKTFLNSFYSKAYYLALYELYNDLSNYVRRGINNNNNLSHLSVYFRQISDLIYEQGIDVIYFEDLGSAIVDNENEKKS
ncbi:BgTH12-04258 [Blumeria graminis f. sp. triticale]|uniref:Bgt-20284 n=2 Tax=Blumeria graminis TaxID=34373 RepID=A0A9X9PRJ8_BLUGR|nr:BgTH12-04258 [Blumeria graminis f. sp. triticale]VCU40386.1 Bgt-20284 [Blumeria graminis f. sp. tritici]